MVVHMLGAISLDRHFCPDTGEIEDVAFHGMLPPELGSTQAAIAQQRPQALFRLGLGTAQGAGFA